MKKLLPYLIGAIILVGVGLLVAGSHNQRQRRFDERITLREKDQIPYGTAAVKSFLPSIFPNAAIVNEDRAPGEWASIDYSQGNQAVVFFSSYFTADDNELNQIKSFVQHGNYVLIVSRAFSPAANDLFKFSYSEHYYDYLDQYEDSLRVKLEKPVFPSNRIYAYPGKQYSNFLSSIDTMHTQVLGRTADGWPNFVVFGIGRGMVFVHTAPLAFSNYFILHKDNIGYIQNVLSVIPKDVDRVVWDEYYLNKPRTNDDHEPNMFAVLMRYPGLKWGLLLGLGVLLLLMLLDSRRRQRKILPHEKPTNDSLDFVKTLGRLYYDRHDHQNLAWKMSVYFLEHVRTVYKLPTHTLDAEFAKALHYKSGYTAEKLNDILDMINSLREGASVNEARLVHFHQQLELFYQNT